MSKYYGNKSHFLLGAGTVLALACFGTVAWANPAPAPYQGLQVGSGFSAAFQPLNGITLATDRVEIRLAGIKLPVSNTATFNQKAYTALNQTIGQGMVQCRLKQVEPAVPAAPQKAAGFCQTAQGTDLAALLLAQGLAQVDVTELTAETGIKTTFLAAEAKARSTAAGLWGNAAPAKALYQTEPAAGEQAQPAAATLAPVYTALAVLGLGLIALFVATFSGLRRLTGRINKLQQTIQSRDRKLQERERYVIAAALEGELNTNRAKLDAFLLIYEETLKTLRDPTKKPKYQKAGDIVHEKPALARSIYDANAEKTSVLGQKLATELAGLYEQIDPNPGYLTLEPETPLPQVRELVEKIIANARNQLDPIDRIIGALGVIMRDKRDSGSPS